ncbi:protein bric-a-brac 1-like isoform X2 [Penaeus japonicus]|uniref:protein bric-a-brac 1-like isoform X2 n=1 Tax=Penaeus japonicus TaxID=27405 RepID=UPI001C7106F3|nr:protein bric-a-brac 1-like isoform X2 [Penaeus japonicus]
MDIEHERGIKKKNQFVMSGTPPAAAGGGGGAAAVAAAAADHFCLRWNNYQTNMTAVFDQLLQEEVFVDVTLSCEGGQQLRAHKVVLAACSPYFQAVLQNNPCKHPIVILPRDVAFADLRAIIEFVYRGEIDVAQEQINSLLAAADTLKIKGLCEVGDDPTHVPPGFTATPSSASRHAASASSSGGLNASSSGSTHTPRGRGSYTRGRYNTSYRPRGRPPLYGRHRYERPSPNTPRSNDHHDHPNSSKRIKLESTEEDGHGNAGGGGGGDEGDGSVQQRPSHHPHYVHNGGAPALPASHGPPAAHAHHGPPPQAVHNPQAHPPAAHAPPPLPELGPSVGLPQPDEGAGTSHGGADYDGTYGGYPKTEGDQGQHLPPDHLSSDHIPSDHLPSDATDASGQRMTVTPELLGLMPSNATSHYSSDTDSLSGTPGARKLWTDEDMDKALDALRNAAMSLSKAAHVYGIPATTLWQRAHRMGIETPKKEGPNKTWSEHDLAGALEELRTGRMSANRASKEFGIPNSTLYKIARKEGIKLSSPFSAIQPSWNPDDLTKALEAIRGGMSVQKAAQEFGIPTGTLYGRCRREGIELSKYQGVPWSEEDMKDALEAVRVGEMSINQAAIHFNLPYSSLYGRFKRGKYEDGLPHQDFLHQEMTVEHYPADPQQPAQNPQQPPQPPQQQQHTPPPQQQQQQQLTPGPPSEQY